MSKQIEYRHLSMPTKIQMHTVVKGDDRYLYRKPFPWWALFLIGAGAYGLYWIFTN